MGKALNECLFAIETHSFVALLQIPQALSASCLICKACGCLCLSMSLPNALPYPASAVATGCGGGVARGCPDWVEKVHCSLHQVSAGLLLWQGRQHAAQHLTPSNTFVRWYICGTFVVHLSDGLNCELKIFGSLFFWFQAFCYTHARFSSVSLCWSAKAMCCQGQYSGLFATLCLAATAALMTQS
jgi:hypothetical protein